jgi:hypothetical protein
MPPVLTESGANRVVHDVPSDSSSMPITLDKPRVETVLEEVSRPRVALVEPHGVEAVQSMHPRGELEAPCRHDEVKVVGHQAERSRSPTEPVDRIAEEDEERAIVAVVEEDLGPSDTPCRDVERAIS